MSKINNKLVKIRFEAPRVIKSEERADGSGIVVVEQEYFTYIPEETYNVHGQLLNQLYEILESYGIPANCWDKVVSVARCSADDKFDAVKGKSIACAKAQTKIYNKLRRALNKFRCQLAAVTLDASETEDKVIDILKGEENFLNSTKS